MLKHFADTLLHILDKARLSAYSCTGLFLASHSF